MTRNIHIHIHRGRVHDATAHDPNTGRFTTSGAGGGDASHHLASAKAHREAAAKKGSSNVHFGAHIGAALAHEKAAESLKKAESRASQGAKGYASRHVNAANEHHDDAAFHESFIGGSGNPKEHASESANRTWQKKMGYKPS